MTKENIEIVDNKIKEIFSFNPKTRNLLLQLMWLLVDEYGADPYDVAGRIKTAFGEVIFEIADAIEEG